MKCTNKICENAGIDLPIIAFYRDKSKVSGFSSWCIKCKKAYNQRPDRKAYNTKWAKSHRIHLRSYDSTRYYSKRREQLKSAKYRHLQYKARARRSNFLFELTLDQFAQLTAQKCTWCGEYSAGKEFCGLDRIDNNLGYIVENVRPFCEMCNKIKLAHSEDFVIEHLKKILSRRN